MTLNCWLRLKAHDYSNWVIVARSPYAGPLQLKSDSCVFEWERHCEICGHKQIRLTK